MKSTFKLALVAAFALSGSLVLAEEDPFADALAAVVKEQVVQPAVKQIQKMPETTIKKVEESLKKKNPPPTPQEMKEDKGVQTVVKMQKAAPKENPPVKLEATQKSAKSLVEDILKKNGVRPATPNKDCIIKIVQVSMAMEKPANVKDFCVSRDMLSKLLLLQAKGEVAAQAAQVFSGKELAHLFDDGTNVVITVSSESEAVAKLPIFGMTVIAQAEAWDGKNYQMAAAVVWSQVLHRATKATLLGEPIKADLGTETLDDWLDNHDLTLMSGPRQMVDKDGKRVYLGIAAREIGISAVRDQLNEQKAKASALSALVLSLFSDVEQRLATAAVLEMNPQSVQALESINKNIAQGVKDRVVQGAGEIKSVETVHPLTGKKMYLSVYSLDAESVANARVMTEELFATRVLTELANKRALGRLQGYLNKVEEAKNNMDEYYKGMEEGERNVSKLVEKHKLIKWKTDPSGEKSPAEAFGLVTGDEKIDQIW